MSTTEMTDTDELVDLRLEAQKQYERVLQEFGPDVDELIIQAMIDEPD